MKNILRFAVAALAAVTFQASQAQSFIDHSKSEKLIDPSVNLLVGGSTTTNNYMSCFPQITDLNTSMRPAWGVGASVKLNFSNFFGIATGLNVTFNSSRMDMAVTGSENSTNISNVFMRNSYRYLDIPLVASFTFCPAAKIRWNVDAGLYYDYGLSGKSKSTIYDARINEIGQLITRVDKISTDYFNDDQSFINSFRRSDIGFHIATGLTFSRRISVGLTAHFGFKNVANTQGLVRPNCHNINFFANLGYHF